MPPVRSLTEIDKVAALSCGQFCLRMDAKPNQIMKQPTRKHQLLRDFVILSLVLSPVIIAIIWCWMPAPDHLPPHPEHARIDARMKARREAIARLTAEKQYEQYDHEPLEVFTDPGSLPEDITIDASVTEVARPYRLATEEEIRQIQQAARVMISKPVSPPGTQDFRLPSYFITP